MSVQYEFHIVKEKKPSTRGHAIWLHFLKFTSKLLHGSINGNNAAYLLGGLATRSAH